MSNKISIIIVNYNSSSYLNRLLKTVPLIKKHIGEIIIIDNNSNDKQVRILHHDKKFTYIFNRTNMGFAKAVNQGIKIARFDYICLLNPDTVITDPKFEVILGHFKDHNVAVVGGGLMRPNGKNYYSATRKPGFMEAILEFTIAKRILSRNPVTMNFWIEKNNNLTLPIDVDSVCGAFLVFRKQINKTVQFFNEDFFLYFEDLDFCLNLKSHNFRVIFEPRYKITHYGGKSSGSKYKVVLDHWYNSRRIFFHKYCNSPLIGILDIIFVIESKILNLYHRLKNEPTE